MILKVGTKFCTCAINKIESIKNNDQGLIFQGLNFRTRSSCKAESKYLTKIVVYKATIKHNKKKISYIGCTIENFKLDTMNTNTTLERKI